MLAAADNAVHITLDLVVEKNHWVISSGTMLATAESAVYSASVSLGNDKLLFGLLFELAVLLYHSSYSMYVT